MTTYRTCAVPMCRSTSIKYPDKLFIHVPKCPKRRKQWLQLAHRNPKLTSDKSTIFFCEDHFNLPDDMENYMEYIMMGSVGKKRMKSGCLPSKFEYQPDKLKHTRPLQPRSAVSKRQHMDVIQEILSSITEMPATSGITRFTSNYTQSPETAEPAESAETAETAEAADGGTQSCGACSKIITGFVYQCVQCTYQMCQECDVAGVHCDHYVLRVPTHSPKSEVEAVIVAVREAVSSVPLSEAPQRVPGSDSETDSAAEEELEVKVEIDIEEHDPTDPLWMWSPRVKEEPLEDKPPPGQLHACPSASDHTYAQDLFNVIIKSETPDEEDFLNQPSTSTTTIQPLTPSLTPNPPLVLRKPTYTRNPTQSSTDPTNEPEDHKSKKRKTTSNRNVKKTPRHRKKMVQEEDEYT